MTEKKRDSNEMRKPDGKYASGEYLRANPSWDIEDGGWEAKKVAEMLSGAGLNPASICEVGCGAGGVLASLRTAWPESELYGFDIAPDAAGFWENHRKLDIHFQLGDFFKLNKQHYDLLLVLDVIEHVVDPWTFLEGLKPWSDHILLHIPLDLSAQNVLRETPILEARRQVGHIHYFTRKLALEMLTEAGYRIDQWNYSGLSWSGPRHSWRSRLALVPRMLAYALNREAGVRLLGGETLFVLASPIEG